MGSIPPPPPNHHLKSKMRSQGSLLLSQRRLTIPLLQAKQISFDVLDQVIGTYFDKYQLRNPIWFQAPLAVAPRWLQVLS